MKRILDQITLLIYGLTALAVVDTDAQFLTALLAAIIYASVSYVYESGKVHLIISALYFLLSFFAPSFLLFLPVVLYNCLRYKNYPGLALIGIVCEIRLFLLSLPLFFLSALGLLTAALLCVKSDQNEELEKQYKRTRDDSTELNLLLKEKNKMLLARQDSEIYTATLKERNRIAREIHDNVGHMLSRSILMVGAMKTMNQDASLDPSLLTLEDTLNQAMTSIRSSVHDLHDDSVNLKDVMTDLTDSFTFCPVELSYDMGYDVPREIKYCFITIIKEALNNVMRHSNAGRVRLTLREHPGLYQLIIEDNGENASLTEGGMGLSNMRERVEALEGTMQIQTTKGFHIFISIPKKED